MAATVDVLYADGPKRVLMLAPKPTVSIGGRRYTTPRDSAEPVVGSASLRLSKQYPQGLAALISLGLTLPSLEDRNLLLTITRLTVGEFFVLVNTHIP
jgi:hypothetical protein